MTADAEVGWIAAIIIGGIAGWLAEKFMKSDMGLLMKSCSASLARRSRAPFSVSLGSCSADGSATWFSGLSAPVLLIWIVRMVRGRTA